MSRLARHLEDPARRVRLRRWAWGGLAAVALAEILLPPILGGHGHFAFESWPAWGSIYGLVSCVVIVVVSKLLGKAWLIRREDYYDS